MKTLFSFFGLLLGGCQSVSVGPKAVAPVVREPPAVVTAVPAEKPVTDWQQRWFRQRQLTEAVISQNDALLAQLAGKSPSTSAPPAASPIPAIALVPVPALLETEKDVLLPNADNIIDLAAAKLDDTVNPFAVRNSAANTREIVVEIQGVVASEHPCAVINDRLLGLGDSLDSMRIVRIQASAVYFAVGDQTLRIPVGGAPVHVRHA